jgi:SAM-dependent methyltransferase
LDVGRRVIQGRHVQALLDRASGYGRFPTILNAGAGEGGYSPLLLKLPGVESLVDSDYGFQDFRPRRIDKRQVFYCASLVSIPSPDQSFDLVLCTEVLEHIQDDQQALDEIARVMSPGGCLIVTVPTPPAPFDPAHVREGYRPEQLSAMLTERGFDIIETRFCMNYLFRFLYRNLPKVPRCPRMFISAIAYLDRLIPMGPPMDLMILARLPGQAVLPSRRETDDLVRVEIKA